MDHHGLSSHDYVTRAPTWTTAWCLWAQRAGHRRNSFGLRGSVSYLIETRGVGIGLQSFQRRVATHYLLAKSCSKRRRPKAPACAPPSRPPATRRCRSQPAGRFAQARAPAARECR